MNSDIKISVELDEKKIPKKIELLASDSPDGKPKEMKSFMLSLFEKDTLDTLKIDLWTKEMQISEMDMFMYQTLKSLADTYNRATKNTPLANDMMKFATYFGEQTKAIPDVD